MKHLLTIISCLLALNLSAQEVVVEYPYNPDFENDGNVGVEDLLQLLSSFGMAFEVGELTIDEVVLSEWLQTISETLIAQQAIIDSLSSLTSSLDSAGVADLLSQANFGSSAGGFNPRYPVIRGTHDLRFNTAAGYYSYTVPTDSIFIIEHAAPSGSAGTLLINDIAVWTASINAVVDSPPLQQLYVGSGETVSTQASWNIHGYLVPNEFISPLTIALPGQESYTVPAGKQFVISTINGDDTGSLQIDNVYRGSYSIGGVQAGLNELYVPLVCSSSTTLFMNNNPDKTARINGYLVDEDYFESSSPSVASEAESLGLAFGERIHLSEPEDWGPLPWDDYVNYGTYAFDDQGIFMGYMKSPFYNIYVLNDSIEMEAISSSELETHSVVEITNGPDAFSIIVGTNERVIVRGMPNSFEYPETERNFDWIPVQSSNTISTDNESEDQSQASVGNASLGSSCRCWPDQGEIIVELPEADFVYLDVEPYLTGSGSSQYDSYNCFKFKLPDGPGFTTMTIIPPHIFNITPPVGSEGDELDALQFEVYSSNFIGHLQYDGGIDNWSWGPHAGWHAWRFIRDHNGDWRPQTTQP